MDTQVLIVGGGPVGLFLALRLLEQGVHCLVLEQRAAPLPHSRAIGIHPPSLELMARLSLADQLLKVGVPVRRGQARSRNDVLGELRFEELLEDRYPFPLSCPQDRTEQILEAGLRAAAPDALLRESKVDGVETRRDEVQVAWRDRAGRRHRASGRFLVGCDGKHSLVREAAGITFGGRRYPDCFVMGDLTTQPELDGLAVLFLGPEGVVESFPLPDGLRRWVARTPGFVREEHAEAALRAAVAERTGLTLPAGPPLMTSSFGVERRQAERLYSGSVVLAGDAAHVISPIGGQGLNLGWLNAWTLAEALQGALQHAPQRAGDDLQGYERLARRRASRAGLRAALNMRLGGGGLGWRLRQASVRLLLRSPTSKLLARLFTMHWL